MVFPTLSGRVVDLAEALNDRQEARITAKVAALEAKTQHQLAVVTVASLQGWTVEDYSLCLANHWALGRKGFDDGVLLIVAPAERKVRIEVGYGLEDTLTNAKALSIITDAILPRFRRGEMAKGIEAGAKAIAAEMD